MVLTTAVAFNEFHDRISPSTATLNVVESRKDIVVAALKKAFPSTSNVSFQSAYLIGSLGRRTASNPVTDLDVMVHLHVDQALWDQSYSADSTKFFYRVRDGLEHATTVQKVGARGQAVRLFYTDGLTVDIAAVEKYSSGAYAIPNGTGGWLSTNPLRHAEYLNEQNANLSGDLKRFIKIVKQWNRAHSSRLHSFHLEMLAARTFSTLGSDTRAALKVFFNYNHYNLSVQDPAGHSGDLSSYLTTIQRQAVYDSLGTAYDQATRAKQAELDGDHREAIRLWRIILGADFPAYG